MCITTLSRSACTVTASSQAPPVDDQQPHSQPVSFPAFDQHGNRLPVPSGSAPFDTSSLGLTELDLLGSLGSLVNQDSLPFSAYRHLMDPSAPAASASTDQSASGTATDTSTVDSAISERNTTPPSGPAPSDPSDASSSAPAPGPSEPILKPPPMSRATNSLPADAAAAAQPEVKLLDLRTPSRVAWAPSGFTPLLSGSTPLPGLFGTTPFPNTPGFPLFPSGQAPSGFTPLLSGSTPLPGLFGTTPFPNTPGFPLFPSGQASPLYFPHSPFPGHGLAALGFPSGAQSPLPGLPLPGGTAPSGLTPAGSGTGAAHSLNNTPTPTPSGVPAYLAGWPGSFLSPAPGSSSLPTPSAFGTIATTPSAPSGSTTPGVFSMFSQPAPPATQSSSTPMPQATPSDGSLARPSAAGSGSDLLSVLMDSFRTDAAFRLFLQQQQQQQHQQQQAAAGMSYDLRTQPYNLDPASLSSLDMGSLNPAVVSSLIGPGVFPSAMFNRTPGLPALNGGPSSAAALSSLNRQLQPPSGSTTPELDTLTSICHREWEANNPSLGVSNPNSTDGSVSGNSSGQTAKVSPKGAKRSGAPTTNGPTKRKKVRPALKEEDEDGLGSLDGEDEGSLDLDENGSPSMQPQLMGSALGGDRSDAFTCTFPGCGKVLQSRFNLRRHVKKHEGSKPFLCSKCPRSFSEITALKRHLPTHANKKPYVCRWAGCGQSFADVSNVKRHEMSHLGLKPFRCPAPDCGGAFTRRSSLKVHMMSKHGIKRDDPMFVSALHRKISSEDVASHGTAMLNLKLPLRR